MDNPKNYNGNNTATYVGLAIFLSFLFVVNVKLYGIYKKETEAKTERIIKLKTELDILKKKTKYIDSIYNENVRLLDSITESNAKIEQRVLNYLHAEKRYRKGQIKQYKD